MARQPRTPGATAAPTTTETEVVAPTTAEQADEALDAILGTPDATGVASEPVEGPAEDKERQEYEEFLAWKQSKASAKSQPPTQHVPTSDATGSVQVQTFLSPDGWTSKGGE